MFMFSSCSALNIPFKTFCHCVCSFHGTFGAGFLYNFEGDILVMIHTLPEYCKLTLFSTNSIP
jgi:hypothetical protein